MTAGSSPDTGAENSELEITITQPAVVEIDTEASAAYVRLSRCRVAKTVLVEREDAIVTVDYDADGQPIGLEILGRREFSISALLKGLPIRAPDGVLAATRYVSAEREPA